MANKKMYGDTIEFDQVNKYVVIPSTSKLYIGATDVTTATSALAGNTSTAAELSTLHSSGITNADLIKVHALTAVATDVTGAGALAANSTNAIRSAAGIALTLPAATGSGNIIRCRFVTTVTSGSTTITSASGSDFYAGTVIQIKIGTGGAYYAMNGTSHRVLTFDGSTKGGLIGDIIDFIDIKANLWSVHSITQATGVVASPVS